ncbi:MAG: alpha/beta hydrolase [Bacteroidetes bacterium]|nr:alpha/beta hydrolase [Bacteroidota bacterium]
MSTNIVLNRTLLGLVEAGQLIRTNAIDWFSKKQTSIPFDFKQAGSIGPEMLMLHGLIGNAANWDNVTNQLKKWSCTYSLNLPIANGFGEDKSIHSLSNYAHKFVEQHHYQKSIICGNSLGGHIALRMYLSNPSKVKALILTGTSGLYEKGVGELSLRPTRQQIYDLMREVVYEEKHLKEEDIQHVESIVSNRHSFINLIRYAKSAKKDNLSKLLPQIKCPVLLIWGENDTITPLDTAQKFNARIPNSKLVVLPKCGHAPMIEYPELFAYEVEKFVKSLE